MPSPSKDLGLSLEDLKAIAQIRDCTNSRYELSSIIFLLKKVEKEKKK